jgi:hypothetical protein
MPKATKNSLPVHSSVLENLANSQCQLRPEYISVEVVVVYKQYLNHNLLALQIFPGQAPLQQIKYKVGADA